MTSEQRAIKTLAEWKQERAEHKKNYVAYEDWAISEYWATVRDMTIALVTKHGWDYSNLRIKAHDLTQEMVKGMGMEDGSC